MKQLEIIEKAVQGGWKGDKPQSLIDPACLLSSSWWQALGKAMRWENDKYFGVVKPRWFVEWHHLIDYLAKDGTVESFFEQLNFKE